MRTGVTLEASKSYTLKVLTGNPVGEEGQGDSSRRLGWFRVKEFIGRFTEADWNLG